MKLSCTKRSVIVLTAVNNRLLLGTCTTLLTHSVRTLHVLYTCSTCMYVCMYVCNYWWMQLLVNLITHGIMYYCTCKWIVCLYILWYLKLKASEILLREHLLCVCAHMYAHCTSSLYCKTWNGISVLPTTPPPSFEVTSDASGHWGCGVWTQKSWLYCSCLAVQTRHTLCSHMCTYTE